jgi:hypothetical protein
MMLVNYPSIHSEITVLPLPIQNSFVALTLRRGDEDINIECCQDGGHHVESAVSSLEIIIVVIR